MSFADRHPQLVEALAEESWSLELDAAGELIIEDAEGLWTPARPDAAGLETLGLPASFAGLFRRPEAWLRVSAKSAGYEVWAFEALGWLGSAGAPALDDALEACAQQTVATLAALDGRRPLPVSMSTFMASARLGPVGIGASQAEVERELGPPEDMMPTRGDQPWDYRQAPIWTYHGLEIYFDAKREVTQISRSALAHHVEPLPSRALSVDFDFLVDGRRPTWAEVEAQARALGLESEALCASGERILALSSGVYFMFDHASDGGGASYIGTNPDYLASLRRERTR